MMAGGEKIKNEDAGEKNKKSEGKSIKSHQISIIIFNIFRGWVVGGAFRYLRRKTNCISKAREMHDIYIYTPGSRTKN